MSSWKHQQYAAESSGSGDLKQTWNVWLFRNFSAVVSEKPYFVTSDESMNKTTRSKPKYVPLSFWTMDELGTQH